jgi:hypothetical protein
LPMQDIHSRRFRIRYISLCQRLLPTHSLHSICFGEKKKRVSITPCLHQETGSGEDAPESSNSTRIYRDSWSRGDQGSLSLTPLHDLVFGED